MNRKHNFCAGPAALPQPVLERAREELLDWQGSGMSVLEVSHRSPEFTQVAASAEANLRQLLAIPDDYAVLLMQGGATGQFAAVPLNLHSNPGAAPSADYINTGHWSKQAMAEAHRYLEVNAAASGEASGFTAIPPQGEWQLDPNAIYLHYTPNETIGGVEFFWVPEVAAPLVADVSSTLLSRPLDVSQFGVLYAGAQKNIGPAGLTLVIVRRDLLGRASAYCPAVLNWQVAADSQSMHNTPPTFALYLAGLVFEWLLDLGGLAAMETINRRKAGKLYAAIDASALYSNPVEVASRSLMNVPFTLADPALDAPFLEQAAAAGLVNLRGHRSVGGMRASIYNAVGEAAVDALVDFMAEFERRG